MFSGQKEKEFKELLESVQTSLLAVQTLDKVRAMASEANKILSRLAFSQKDISYTNIGISDEQIRAGLAGTRALSVLSSNLSVLDWSVALLNRLNQKAWLAGTVDTVE